MNEWMNQSINDEAVYRTAPATPGLLNISDRKCNSKLCPQPTKEKNKGANFWIYSDYIILAQPLLLWRFHDNP